MPTAAHDPQCLVNRLLSRAAQIHRSLQVAGQLQVRWHAGRLLTYRFPAPRGYGVHGKLVAVYSAQVPRAWIEADLLAFADSVSDTCVLSHT